MKLIIREYLASLKERGELDAILPDLLSGLGFNVFSRPGRGTIQHGVDVAAVRKEGNGEEKVYLFSVKQGDLTRQDWDGTAQGLRSSINEILDVYIPSKLPKRYKDSRVAICLCFGGEVKEQVRAQLTLFTSRHSSDRISFEEWNGDKLAELLLSGILREEILPKPLRSSFQKAVAMVDEPDIAYGHFADLVRQLTLSAGASGAKRVTAARQLYICLWILFVWARDINNVDAPYRASELVLLAVWNLLRPHIGKRSASAKRLTTVLDQLILLYLTITSEVVDNKIAPEASTLHALTMAVASHNYVDVNLKLFDVLGRVALAGLWTLWVASFRREKIDESARREIENWTQQGFHLIKNNPTLLCPLRDQHAIEVSLFLLLVLMGSPKKHDLPGWLREMVGRINFTLRTHGRYPTIFNDYRDLINHPRERTDEYRKEATAGSILIPLLAAWLTPLQERQALNMLVELKQTVLAHCTLQLWLPDEASEDQLYVGGHEHGLVLTDLPLSESGEELIDVISEACRTYNDFESLSANEAGFWPIILVACRHHRYPVPPHFWIQGVSPAEHATTEARG